MMSKDYYLKDSKKYWETYKKAREARDKELAKLPFSEKVAITEKLQIDAEVLRNAKEKPIGLGETPLEAVNKVSIKQPFLQHDFEAALDKVFPHLLVDQELFRT